MKNLPEKIYAYIPEDDIVGTASTKKGVPHQYVDIEYIRKDVFIEKAAEWIKENLLKHTYAYEGEVGIGMAVFLEEFKNYMKGE